MMREMYLGKWNDSLRVKEQRTNERCGEVVPILAHSAPPFIAEEASGTKARKALHISLYHANWHIPLRPWGSWVDSVRAPCLREPRLPITSHPTWLNGKHCLSPRFLTVWGERSPQIPSSLACSSSHRRCNFTGNTGQKLWAWLDYRSQLVRLRAGPNEGRGLPCKLRVRLSGATSGSRFPRLRCLDYLLCTRSSWKE
jgi:hypothetical protein